MMPRNKEPDAGLANHWYDDGHIESKRLTLRIFW